MGQERQRRDVDQLPGAGAQGHQPARIGPFRGAQHVQSQLTEHRPVHRIQQGLVVVVPGDHHDEPAVLAQGQQGAHDQALRFRGRCRGLEEIPGDQHHVHVLVAGGRHDAAEHGHLLVVPVPALEDLPHVPVAGVQDLHPDSPLSDLRGRPCPRTAAGRRQRRGWWQRGPQAGPGRRRDRPIRLFRWGGWPTRGTGNPRPGAPGCQAGR